MDCVLDYIYQGEVQICQEQLDRFLVVAQRLQLEGLTSQDDEKIETELKQTTEDTQYDYVIFSEVLREKHKTFKTEKEAMKPRKLSTSTLMSNNSNTEINQQLSEFIVRREDGIYSVDIVDKLETNIFRI